MKMKEIKEIDFAFDKITITFNEPTEQESEINEVNEWLLQEYASELEDIDWRDEYTVEICVSDMD